MPETGARRILHHLLRVVVQNQVRLFLGQGTGRHIAVQLRLQAVHHGLFPGILPRRLIRGHRLVQRVGSRLSLGQHGRGIGLRRRFRGRRVIFRQSRSSQAQRQRQGQQHRDPFFHLFHGLSSPFHVLSPGRNKDIIGRTT